MDNESTNLDKLFSKKFENFESQSKINDWEKLSTQLSKLNFLKFSFATFNVYFVVVFISFAATTTYLGINNWNKSEKIETLERKIDTLQEQVNKIVEVQVETDTMTVQNYSETINKQDIAITPIKKNEILEKQTFENNKTTSNSKPVKFNTDSVDVKQQPIVAKTDSSNTIAKRKTRKVKRVKKTVVVKQDNVIVKDTVVIKGKGK